MDVLRPSSSRSADDEREALRRLVDRPLFELIPLRDALERAEALPAGAATTVTASPSHGIEATIDLCEALIDRGHPSTTPHLAAHMLRDRAHLSEILLRCRAAGIREAFVIGGDAKDRNEFHDALAFLRSIAELGSPFERIGIAGYPEGHPSIPDQRLVAALLEKQEFASYVTTQMTFDADAISGWIRSVRAEGVTLPVHVGLPGVAKMRKLLGIAARIGVGGSIRYIGKNRQVLAALFRRSFTPDRLLGGLASTLSDSDAKIEALHLFTFNQVAETVAWQRRALDELS